MREWLLHLLVLTGFVEGVVVGPVSAGRVMFVVALLVVVLTLAADPDTRIVPHPAVGIPAVLLFAWVLVSGAWAGSRGSWLGSLYELVLALGFFTAYTVLISSRDVVRRLLITFAVGALVVAPLGIVQAAQAGRAIGLQGDPNTYALYQLAALPIAVFLAVRAQGWARAGWSLTAVLLVASVLAAQSRGAAVALVLVAFWLLWDGAGTKVTPAQRGVRIVAGGVTTVAAYSVAALWFPRFELEAAIEGGGTGRWEIWRAALQGWQERPWLGLGAGNFEAQSGRLLSQTPGLDLDPHSVTFDGIKVHNMYLEPLVDLGPVGLATVLALLAGTAALLVQDRRRHPTDVIGALVPMLLGFAVAATFLSAVSNKLLWALAGFAAALPYVAQPRGGLHSEQSKDRLREPPGGVR